MLRLPKWKKDANEFTVSVNHNTRRGYQSSIPKPVMQTLGNPEKITFVLRPKKKVEIVVRKSALEQEERHNV